MKDKDEANIGHEGTMLSTKKLTMLQGNENSRRNGFKCKQKTGFQ